MSLQDEMYKQMLRQKQLEEYNRQKKQQRSNYINSAKNFYDNIQNSGSKLSGWGKNLSQSQNPKLANLGTKMQTIGDKIQGFRQPGMPSLIGGGGVSTGAGGSAVANGISSVAPSATSTLGSGAGATTGLGSSLAGTSTGSSALGSSLLGATGGSSAGMGAAGATSAIGGSTAAATGAGAAGAGAAGGAAMGAAGGAAMAVPVAGWVVAAALAAKAIKDKFDEAHKKVNAKAMQADSNAMQESAQANAEGIAQDQNAFQNAAMESAQQMTQPSTYDDIMSRIQPVGNAGSPTGFAADINLPNEEETLQNNQSTQPQVEDINGNVSAFPTTREGFAKSLTDNGWQQDTVNAALQGLNGGNKDMADYITAYNNNAADGQQIAIPQTDEEIELARNGQFYQPEQSNTATNATKESLFERIKNGLGQFKAGYDDNSTTGFADGDLANKLSGNAQQPVIAQNGTLTGGAATTKKTIMNRLGEAAGTGRRLMANPWVQAGIAAAISKADGGDVGDMAQAAYKYGTAKAMSDQYYRQLHPDAKVMPVLNTYGVDDYKAKAYNDFNQGRTVMSRRDLIKLQNPTMSDKDIEDLITKSGINGDELVSIKGYESVEKAKNNTRKTDIQEDKNKWQRDQGQQKIGIQQQNANTNARRLTETQNHNRITEAQGAKRNEIAEKKLNNKNTSTKVYTQSNGQTYTEGARGIVNGRPVIFLDGKWVDDKSR